MNELDFIPVRGKESKILSQSAQLGNIYFATDTGKIYMDVQDEITLDTVHKAIGGSGSALLYAEVSDIEQMPDRTYRVPFSALKDSNNIPNPNDLIINLTDGKFLKVSTIEATECYCDLIAVSGTGGGGGGGGGSSSKEKAVLSIPNRAVTMLYNTDYDFKYNLHVLDAEGNPVYGPLYRIQISVGLGKTLIHQETVYSSEETQSFNLGEALRKVSVTPGNTYGLTFTATYYTTEGVKSEPSMYCTVSLVSLTFTPPEYDFSESFVIHNKNQSFKLNWSLSGNLNKISKLYVDDQLVTSINTGPNASAVSYEFPADYFSHRHHKIKITTEGWIDEYTSVLGPTFEEEYLFYEAGNTVPVIACQLKTSKVTQYSTLSFPIIIYDASGTNDKIFFDIYENYPNLLQKDIENVNGATYLISYTPKTYGSKILSIMSGAARRDLNVEVEELILNNVSEKSGYTFKFKASDFLGNQGVKDWIFENDKKIQFSDNFDWWNGGIVSSTEGQCFRVKAGNFMTIPYSLFAQDATLQGKSIKIIYKSHSCRDYETEFLKSTWIAKRINTDKDNILLDVLTEGNSYDIGDIITIVYPEEAGQAEYLTLDYINENIEFNSDNTSLFHERYVQVDGQFYQCYMEGEEPYYYKVTLAEAELGLILRAQEGTLFTPSGNVSVQYCEDTYMELEFDFGKKDTVSKSNPKNYLKTWIDGVPASILVYGKNTKFQGTNNTYITIGSEDCDVDIYLIKIYETGLTDEEHIQNYIVDALTAEEINARYKRNDILLDPSNSAAGISYTKLAQANPNCLVHLYDIEAMTKTKKDKKKVYKYEQYHNSNFPILAAENLQFKVQGTSSEKYVVAAANLDTDFADEDGNTKFYDPQNNNEKLPNEGWGMSADAIPVNFFCTKVNVASCENANNALNQEWYNLFQPYQTVLRCKNNKARDTMQFTNGVIFIKDRNEDYDQKAADPKTNNIFGEVSGYMSTAPAERPYLFYSLGQMGNSKDNIQVFHDLDNPLECCIEVKDNQEPQQWMITDEYEDVDVGGGKKYYEFRYPEDGEADNAQDLLNGWRRLVNWMATSNPQPRYEKHEEVNAELFSELKEKYAKVYYLSADQSEYIEVDGYDEDLTTVYTETQHKYGYTNLPLETPVKYDAYTFKGYKADAEIQAKYSPIVAGITFTPTYDAPGAEEFTHDTYNYRIAKMVNECEDYLVMDSILYHYLFIERHSMIDNVAKNTFWSTEDGLRWNLVKDYDNDTANGNDNNGRLTVPYGSEAFDVLPNGRNTFNAHRSVWFNFIYGIPTVCESFYSAMEDKCKREVNGRLVSCWDKQAYLDFFTEWQSRIPERCWVNDYYRKYIRPYELYGIKTFLPMLEGGQKKYQRKQYETYQGPYISSKYEGAEARADVIQLRTGTVSFTEAQPAIIPVKLYSDGYFTADRGGQKEKTRLKRGEIGTVQFVGDFNNATFDLSPISLFSQLGTKESPLEQVKVDLFNTSVTLAKLRELVIGTGDPPNYGASPITNFSLGTRTPLLEKAYLAHINPNDATGLDLSDNSRLLELDARDSNFTDIVIADGAPTETIMLGEPSTLQLTNLRFLTTLTIQDYSNLVSAILHNIDSQQVNLSKNVIQRAASLNDYDLQEIRWELNNTSEIKADNSIGLIDKLSKISSDAKLLSGHILVTKEVASVGFEPQQVYDKYTTLYPSLDIEFRNAEDENWMPKVEIRSQYSQLPWSRRTVLGNTIDANFFAGGPSGAYELQKIVSTVEKEYEFLNKWNVYDLYTGALLTTVAGEWPQYTVNRDIYFEPVYNTNGAIRKYPVTIKNFDGTILLEEDIEYGTSLNKVHGRIQTPQNYVYTSEYGYDDISNNIYLCWKFEGYKIGNSPITTTIENFEKVTITDETILTAAFKKTHVYDNPLENATGAKAILSIDDNGILNTLQHENPSVFNGRITIPNALNGIEVRGLGTGFLQQGFKVESNGVTAIFFQPKNYTVNDNLEATVQEYQSNISFTQYALSTNSATTIEMPLFNEPTMASAGAENVAFIDGYAKNIIFVLETTVIPNNLLNRSGSSSITTNIEAIMRNITHIGDRAFNQCGNIFINLPSSSLVLPSIVSIGTQAMYGCNGETLQTYFGGSSTAITFNGPIINSTWDTVTFDDKVTTLNRTDGSTEPILFANNISCPAAISDFVTNNMSGSVSTTA